jgi:hypothetical protein
MPYMRLVSPTVAAVVLLALAAAVARGAPGRSTADLVPADCDLYIEWNGAADQRAALLQSAFWDRLKGTAFFQAILRDRAFADFQTFRGHWRTGFGTELETTVDDLLGGQAALAGRTRRGAQPEGLVLGRARSAAAVKDFLTKWLAHEVGKGTTVREHKHGDVPVYQVNKTLVAVAGENWFVTENVDVLRAALDLLSGKGAALSGHPPYREALADLPTGHAGHLYFEAATTLSRLPEARPGTPDARFRALFATVRWLAVSAHVGGGELRVEGRVRAAEGGFHPLLSTLLGAAPVAPEALKLLPADVILAGGVAVDPAALRRGIETTFPETRSNVQVRFGTELFFKMYAERMGPEFVLAVRRAEPAAGFGVKVPAVAVAARLRDADVVPAVHDALELALAAANDDLRNKGVQLKVRRDTYRGRTITVLEPGPPAQALQVPAPVAAGVRPSLAQVGGFLVAATHDSILRAMLDTADGAAPNLGGSSTLRALAPLPADGATCWAMLSAPVLADALADHRELLALAAAFQEGIPHDEAAGRLDAALELLRMFDGVGLVRRHTPERSAFALRVRVADR